MGDDKPNPLEDVRKGLGLLFRAAKSAVEKLPKGGVEEIVVTSAREVGRALENVASTIEREVFGAKKEPDPKRGEHREHETGPDASPPGTKDDDEKPPGAV